MERKAIKELAAFRPEIGLILGSGLGAYGEKLADPGVLRYEDIPGHPVSRVEGHGNRYLFGTLFGKRIVAMQGRVHYYEGFGQEELAIPVRLMRDAGVRTLILTNAAGGVNVLFSPGDLMLITDHINLSGGNPLRGANADEYGPRFPDLSEVYSRRLREMLKERCGEQGISLQEGVYVMNAGPSYETPAEIRMARILGGDAVGMSTVPEAIAARHAGMEVLGISCITNMAAGILPQPLSHREVMETAERVKTTFEAVIDTAIQML